MADTDHDTEVELGAVLQLAPNKKATQQAPITKKKEEELVSLDELYEETGQENITTFLEGFRLLVSANKLSKLHGAVLNVKGFENWVDLPDTLNAYKGGESFLTALKKGLVAIVKSIVTFSNAVANWAGVRIKSLVNYNKTIDDTIFIHKSSDEYRRVAISFLKDLGVTDFNETEFLNSLPPNLTTSEILTITKIKLDSSEKSFERVREANAYIQNYTSVINSAYAKLKRAKTEYDATMQDVKDKIKRDDVSVADVKEITLSLTKNMDQNLRPVDLVNYLDGLLKILYDIDINGIGLKTNFKHLREKIEKVSEDVKLTFNDKLFEHVNSLTLDLYKNLYKGANYSNEKVDPAIVTTLKQFINESNSALIEKLSDLSNDKKLAATYIAFCDTVATYPVTIDIILIAIQRVESSIVSIMKWHSYLNDIIIAYVTRNIAQLAAAQEKLPPDVRKKIDTNKAYIQYVSQLEDHAVSDAVANKAAKFFNTTKGKELLQYYSNIAT